jgi:hypothetical protein
LRALRRAAQRAAVPVFDPKVRTLAYQQDGHILEITFKNGQVWQLFGVKPDIYDELLHATLSSFLNFLAHRYKAAPVRKAPAKDRAARKRILPRMQAADDGAASNQWRHSSHPMEVRGLQSILVAHVWGESVRENDKALGMAEVVSPGAHTSP